MNTLILSLVMLTASSSMEAAAVQEVLEAAKAHYAAASYEDALMTLARADVRAPEHRVEIEQYRALCLIALGRMPEAERAVAEIVGADPKYVPSPDIASPRVVSLIAEMRQKELPAVARRLLATGREAFEAKDLPRARENFQLLVDLLEDPATADLPDRQDMHVLAQGFVTLAEAASRPLRPEPAARAEAAPQPAPAPVAPPVILPAVAIQQDIPTWVPPDVTAGSRAYKGSIRIRIGADGRVKSAKIEETTHPAFDVRLLRAAESWMYQPATRNGVPMESEKVVAVQLNPR